MARRIKVTFLCPYPASVSIQNGKAVKTPGGRMTIIEEYDLDNKSDVEAFDLNVSENRYPVLSIEQL